jgi:hypothetical protein
MLEDPIVDEVRKAREEHAKRCGYDLDAIFRDLKAREKESGKRYARYPPRPATPVTPARPS